MRDSFAVVAVAASLVSASGSACAMSSPEPRRAECRVVGGEKLPPESGGADALCAAIERAMAERAPALQVSAEVRVLSASRLRATLTAADGRVLRDQNYAVSDRALNQRSFERFAQALASALLKPAS